jgi:hypothetical protein
MRKTFCALGLLLTATLSFAGVSARADDTVSTQITNQSAGAVGNGNQIYQESNQLSVQQVRDRGGSSSGTLDNLQRADQAAGAVGNGNVLEQHNSQVNVQQRATRRPQGYNYYGR